MSTIIISADQLNALRREFSDDDLPPGYIVKLSSLPAPRGHVSATVEDEYGSTHRRLVLDAEANVCFRGSR